MFNRVVYEDSTALFTIVAFAVALSIFLVISIKALRMKPNQVKQFGDLPFSTSTPPATKASSSNAIPPAS